MIEELYLPLRNYLFWPSTQQLNNKYIISMKTNGMRTPAVTQIYNQRQTYEFHIRKLERIREQRKNQLAYDQHRTSQLEYIKQNKSKSFAHKFNEQNQEISKSNVRLLDKLEKVKPFTRYTSFSSYEKQDGRDLHGSFMKPSIKKRIIETQKENSRIFNKMRSVSSSLNKNKLLREYAKSQQIKSRIARYANENNKVSLKSQKFLNLNSSALSGKSSERSAHTRIKTNLASHYQKEDILKNKIENDNDSILKSRRGKRPETSGEQTNKEEGFFTTEPEKVKRSKTGHRKIYF